MALHTSVAAVRWSLAGFSAFSNTLHPLVWFFTKEIQFNPLGEIYLNFAKLTRLANHFHPLALIGNKIRPSPSVASLVVATEDDLLSDHRVGMLHLQAQLLFPQKCLVYPFSIFKKVTFHWKQMAGCFLPCVIVFLFFLWWVQGLYSKAVVAGDHETMQKQTCLCFIITLRYPEVQR